MSGYNGLYYPDGYKDYYAHASTTPSNHMEMLLREFPVKADNTTVKPDKRLSNATLATMITKIKLELPPIPDFSKEFKDISLVSRRHIEIFLSSEIVKKEKPLISGRVAAVAIGVLAVGVAFAAKYFAG